MPRKPNPALCPKRGHLWKVTSMSGKEVSEQCSRCEERRARALNAVERKRYKAYAQSWSKGMSIHKLAHAFHAKTKELTGYDMMEAADRWAKKHPGRITTARVDDSSFSGSSLVFITHEDRECREASPFKDPGPPEPKWMGVSVYYVAQCSGDKPVQFFLYPNHVDGLLTVLNQLKKRQESFPEVRAEVRRRREYMREKKVRPSKSR